MIGKTILHYKILEKLGEGGMGVVYKAEDTKLKRIVAIKFLPRQIAASDEERERFKIEAQAAAALNHPNIATIHAIEEVDGAMFIVMEFIEGKELRQIVGADGRPPLPMDRIIDIATQIASGLQAAHAKGVTHRDIKSSNIMVTETGQIKIMDFGLAKIAGGAQLTKDHSTLGTAAYMSPEQARGEPVDHRTDIWALGVVLYEMLTGQLPFRGVYEQAMIYSILNEAPEPLTGVAPEVVQIVMKALAKNPNERYQSAAELAAELRAIEGGQVSGFSTAHTTGARRALSQRNRIFLYGGITAVLLLIAGYFFFRGGTEIKERIPVAVADFVNETNEPELNSLSGMLITALEKSRRLSVLTRSRVFDVLRQIGKEDVDKIDENIGHEVCRKLNIHVLAIGTIRKFGKNYSIDLKIIDPIKNEYLFTASEEAKSQEEIPAVLDRISDKTREGLQEKEDELIQTSQKVNVVTTTNLEAYQHFFKGKEHLDKMRYRDAEEELKKAVQLDSSFGLAIYQFAVARYNRDGRTPEIESLINKAVDLIESIPEREQYLVQAMYQAINSNYPEAISILITMETNYPDDKEMCTMLARYAFSEGNYQLAQEYFEKVIRLDPEYELAWAFWGGSLPAAYIMTGKLEDGLAKLIQLKNQYPGANIIDRNIADFYCYLDRYEEAEQEYENILKKEQPLESKIDNLYNKIFFLPYRGKYKEALKTFDYSINLAKQAGDTSIVASMLTFKSIYYVWGWGDIENAKIVAREAEKYHKHLNYPLSYRLLYFYQQNYDRAMESSADGPIIKALIQSRLGYCDSLKIIVERRYEVSDQLTILFLQQIAECQIQTDRFDDAISSLTELQKIYFNIAGFRAVYYPKSYFLLGTIYEKKGDRQLAIENYEKFLNLWKEADPDLPELIEVKARYARLTGSTEK